MNRSKNEENSIIQKFQMGPGRPLRNKPRNDSLRSSALMDRLLSSPSPTCDTGLSEDGNTSVSGVTHISKAVQDDWRSVTSFGSGL